MLGLWRIAGISGVLGGLAGWWVPSGDRQSIGMLILTGLLVGTGTALASGCTSGHGVCGMALLSTR